MNRVALVCVGLLQAGELAAQMEGVLFLDNRIRESTSLDEQLQPTCVHRRLW